MTDGRTDLLIGMPVASENELSPFNLILTRIPTFRGIRICDQNCNSLPFSFFSACENERVEGAGPPRRERRVSALGDSACYNCGESGHLARLVFLCNLLDALSLLYQPITSGISLFRFDSNSKFSLFYLY